MVRCWRAPKFEAEVYVLTKEEGGRHTPLFGNCRPQFYFRTTDVTGTVGLKDGLDMVMPGDNAELTVELDQRMAMEERSRFAVREGNKTLGASSPASSSDRLQQCGGQGMGRPPASTSVVNNTRRCPSRPVRPK